MKVNLGVFCHNSKDWDRVIAGDYSRPPETPDHVFLERAIALGDLAEPLGFDGIWAPEHFGTPYGMTPNPIQTLTYFAGRTERVTFGTMVAVVPWWNPIRLAHQIAYLDAISKGRFQTIGLGRGVAKQEFEAVGVPREESRERLNETLDILKLAFSQERFSYDGKIFKIPEGSIRPAPRSTDLYSRIFASAATRESLEILVRRGLTPLFVGNKPIEDAGKEVQFTNTIRQELGLKPTQPKNVLFMYCTKTMDEAKKAEEYLITANRDAVVHYGFADPSNYAGVKGYEAYADRAGKATAVLAEANSKDAGDPSKKKTPGYHASNLMIGTPEEVVKRIKAAQVACSFQEITIVSQFGTMPYEEAERSTTLFAQECLPEIHKMDTPIHASVLPLAKSA
jgi:alkanesulfonate monooxygenase SsuD/methylene tetrahydromethanopterin reductase-like flavin-dependent oxidoreductase (luciferase family)